jgi:MOSC domain-containing protein YiiM
MTFAADAVVLQLWRCPAKARPMERVVEAELVAGRGMVGDRRFSLATRPMNQVTLIEAEALAAAVELLRGARGVDVEPSARRNIITRGVALNHLVGRTFSVGGARLRGIELCEPCGHLAKMTSSTFSSALIHRGGLRCEIVEGAVVREGDRIVG